MSFEAVIREDHDNILNIVNDRYGDIIDTDLTKEFPFSQINILPTPIKITNKPHRIPTENRCEGRIWGTKTSVYYDEKTKQWNTGSQCKRKAQPDNLYCKIHIKSLTHGNINKDPHHNHFEKYKI
jgi:hypothetical protein